VIIIDHGRCSSFILGLVCAGREDGNPWPLELLSTRERTQRQLLGCLADIPGSSLGKRTRGPA